MLLLGDDPVDPVRVPVAGEGDDVYLAVLVLAERADLERLLKLFGHPPGAVVLRVQRPDLPRAEVSEEVEAVEARVGGATVDVSSRYRAASSAPVLGHWLLVRALVAPGAGRVAVQPFHDRPAEVQAAGATARHAVDLFEGVLADVADPEVAVCAVEAVAPGVPHPHRPDLRQIRRVAEVRVVGWDGVGLAGVHVQAEHLAEQRLAILAV